MPDDQKKNITDEVTDIRISNARIEERLKEVHRMIKGISEYPAAIENAKVRIDALEKSERENRRARFKIFSGLFFALISSIGAILSNLIFR